MNRINDKELNQYMKRIKLLLPLYRKQEKQFLTDFRFCIYDFTKTHPEHSFADITAHFGTPDEVVRDYLSSLDVDLLCSCALPCLLCVCSNLFPWLSSGRRCNCH